MPWTREQMAERAAKELRDGFYVNLGIGIPTLVANYIPAGMKLIEIAPGVTADEIRAKTEADFTLAV